MRRRRGGDLYFVLASCLICLTVFFSVIMPKVQANRAARARLENAVREARERLEEAAKAGRRGRALEERDPFFLTASLRWYLELQGRPWPAGEQRRSDARDP